MPQTKRLITAEEFAEFHEEGYRHELVEGRIVRMSLPGFRHGRVVVRIASLLDDHVRKLRLGQVVAESGYTLARNPDTVRGPDVSFVRRERIASTGAPDSFWEGAPDLAVEVISPSNRAGNLRRKIDEYFGRGTQIVVVVDPLNESVTVHRRLAPPIISSGEDELDVSDVIDGFRCQVRELFE
jgi:Uma2 family endonuclease